MDTVEISGLFVPDLSIDQASSDHVRHWLEKEQGDCEFHPPGSKILVITQALNGSPDSLPPPSHDMQMSQVEARIEIVQSCPCLTNGAD